MEGWIESTVGPSICLLEMRHKIIQINSRKLCGDTEFFLFTVEIYIWPAVFVCVVQPTWTPPTGSSLTFASITLGSLASGPAWSSQWCLSLEPWWSTGSSCPIFSTTRASLSTVSHKPTAPDPFWWTQSQDCLFIVKYVFSGSVCQQLVLRMRFSWSITVTEP